MEKRASRNFHPGRSFCCNESKPISFAYSFILQDAQFVCHFRWRRRINFIVYFVFRIQIKRNFYNISGSSRFYAPVIIKFFLFFCHGRINFRHFSIQSSQYNSIDSSRIVFPHKKPPFFCFSPLLLSHYSFVLYYNTILHSGKQTQALPGQSCKHNSPQKSSLVFCRQGA